MPTCLSGFTFKVKAVEGDEVGGCPCTGQPSNHLHHGHVVTPDQNPHCLVHARTMGISSLAAIVIDLSTQSTATAAWSFSSIPHTLMHLTHLMRIPMSESSSSPPAQPRSSVLSLFPHLHAATMPRNSITVVGPFIFCLIGTPRIHQHSTCSFVWGTQYPVGS